MGEFARPYVPSLWKCMCSVVETLQRSKVHSDIATLFPVFQRKTPVWWESIWGWADRRESLRGPFSSFSRIFIWWPCTWTHNEGTVYHSCPRAPGSVQRRLSASSSYPIESNLTNTGLQFPPTNRINIQSSTTIKSAKTSHCCSCLWDTSVYFLDISYTLRIHSVHGRKESEGTLNAAAKLCLVDFSMF